MFELLLADDDREVLELLALAFQRPGVRLSLARSFEEALSAAFAAPLDAAVLDVHLEPEARAEGLELLHRLQHSRSPVPVIVITGSAERGLLGRAYRLGAQWFMRKPLDLGGLEQQLRLLGLPRASTATREDPGACFYRGARYSYCLR
jgi:two-component system response regulator QseB